MSTTRGVSPISESSVHPSRYVQSEYASLGVERGSATVNGDPPGYASTTSRAIELPTNRDGHAYSLAVPKPSYQSSPALATRQLPVDDLSVLATSIRANNEPGAASWYKPLVDDGVNVTALSALDIGPAMVDCPFCHQRTRTKVSERAGSGTAIAAIFCCLFTCIGGPLALACTCCGDTVHECEQCGHEVAVKTYNSPHGYSLPAAAEPNTRSQYAGVEGVVQDQPEARVRDMSMAQELEMLRNKVDRLQANLPASGAAKTSSAGGGGVLNVSGDSSKPAAELSDRWRK